MSQRTLWLIPLITGLFVGGATADIVYVDDDAPPDGDGTTWQTAYDELMSALTAAGGRGDVEVRVAGGEYQPHPSNRNAYFPLQNGVIIRGGYRGLEPGGDPNERDLVAFETILSGELGDPGTIGDNTYVILVANGVDETAGIDGVTVWRGNDLTGAGCGGLLVQNGNPTVRHVRFVENRATNYAGAGLRADNATGMKLDHCTFIANSAPQSCGGLRVGGQVDLFNCTFLDNFGNANGAAVFFLSDTVARVQSCFFAGNNSGREGGAMHVSADCEILLINSVLVHNVADRDGGGIINKGGLTIINSTIAYNQADDDDDGYEGGGIKTTSTDLVVANSILWRNRDSDGDTGLSSQIDGSTAGVTYSLVSGIPQQNGNIDADPLFVDPDGDDDIPGNADDNVRLSPGSPAIDAGNNTALPAEIGSDLDDKPRFIDDPDTPDTGFGDPPLVDMGPYEFGTPFLAGDLNCDGEVTFDDINPFVIALSGEAAYQAAFPDCNWLNGDLDGNDQVDFDDINPFVALLSR